MTEHHKSILNLILHEEYKLPYTLKDVSAHLNNPPSHIFEHVKKREYELVKIKAEKNIQQIIKEWHVKEDQQLIYYLKGTKTKEKASGPGRVIGDEIKKYDRVISELLNMYGASQSGI
jgi:hypothetical protein